MAEMKHPHEVRIWQPFVWFTLIAVSSVYVLNVVNSQDWWWFFSRSVDAHPTSIIILKNGRQTLIQPGHPDFNRLAEAVHQSVSQFNNTSLIDIGLGAETVTSYQQQGVVLELYYNQPLDFHAPFRAGKPTQLLVPIEGHHAGHDYFFRGDGGEWWFGAMRMEDSTPLITALHDLGYIMPVSLSNSQ